ncbi:PTS glucose transporter subunit IIA [Alishewanella sp. 16-MA]|uniref:PTS glucose transporter subunit IIA n=1 Tax=Alishewanella maricola TaxID=2795740 RepID=A0ABS8C6D5_9ALTE|nr:MULTISPECIES: PTS glucose transporter subunit IIA [Gammaproteobacteria]MCB5227510.1 PTS glucose transporter subunit IIA [Alishewanella maricola]MDP4944348.1 PTS glucose transporter subunit IIA [Alishewanella sp.]MCC5452114.1 PTS glucose transporter subunit IIA [Rheinheimera sp. UJ51]MCF4009753.1 PTS glucose transporter subunit IIA [Rheinheimera sp. UJ63]MDP5036260.1 PTS glucose transporter subunit IIA [Alishewanella sp.]
MQQSVIIWQQDWTTLEGFIIKSPFSGQVLPISMHPELLYQQDIFPATLCCKLQQGTLYAPFSGHFTTARAGERRLIFTHTSGLTLTVDLPFAISIDHGKGLHWLCRAPREVKAGTPILQIDLAYWQLVLDELYCVASLSLPSKLDKLLSRQAQVLANQDPLFVLQFKK